MVGIAREMSGEWYGRGHRARHEDRCSPCPCREQPGPRSRDNMFMPDNRSMPGSAPTPDQYLPAGPGGAEPRDVREIADGYVLARGTLAELTRVEAAAQANGAGAAGDERRCARLLRERLEAGLATSEQGEHLRAVSNIFGPPHRVRSTFLDMPTATEADWAAVARRMARVGQAFAQYRASLADGAGRGLLAGPRVVRTAAEQM